MRRHKTTPPAPKRDPLTPGHSRHRGCGSVVIVGEAGDYRQRGARVRTCKVCRKRINQGDLYT